MKKMTLMAAALAIVASAPFSTAQASPQEDLKAFRQYFFKRFPGIPLDEYRNGVYALDSDARSSWEAIQEFPPYEDALDKGKKLFNTPFANGKTYASCFKNGGIGIRQNYPYFDKKSGEVKTLEMEINECRVTNGEKPLPWLKGDIAAISAYMASTSNGKKLDIKIPNDPRALAWYEKGKKFYFERRGQLNLSCANCHVDNSGMRIRSETLGPGLGQPAHFPVWRLKWNSLGTLDRRYTGCNKQVRAKPFKPQSPEYRALEYYQSYMSNGITVDTPTTRK